MTDKFLVKHIYPNALPNQKFYFYEGQCDVHYGVIELPVNAGREHWANRAWLMGFRLDPETGRQFTRDEMLAAMRGESTKSADEDADEGTDFGGQPAGEDGVRESEPARDESVPSAGVGSRRRRRTAVAAGGDGPAD